MQSAILFIFAGTIGCTIVAAAVQYACLTMYWYLAVRRRKPSATEQQTAATIETTVPLNAVAATAFVTVRGPANPHSHAEASANSGNVREALHATVTNSERYACMEPQLGELESDDYYCNGEQLAGVLSPISITTGDISDDVNNPATQQHHEQEQESSYEDMYDNVSV